MKRTLLLICISFFIYSNLLCSTKGDEDAKMLNDVNTRDQLVINEALNGWWKKSMITRDERVAWWQEARFGMFIHWGIYSLPGGEWKGKQIDGYAEHLMRKEKISRKGYLELAGQFNPDHFDANQWVTAAKKAGMRYMVITAKHHDGFAMYDSKVSDFNVVKQTPFHRDPIAELSEACTKQGMKFGFYYSHAFDWEHPDAPGNDWEYNNPGGDKDLFGGRNWYDLHPELLTKSLKYVDEKAIPQIKELLLNYHPDILWFDTPHKLPLSENIRILKAIREVSPNVVVNGRLARSQDILFGDYLNTGDRPAEFASVKGDWEGIPTTNESYGYNKFDKSHKSAPFFIQLLAKAAARGGNTLMNIGPMGNGLFDPKDDAILTGIGKWMDVNSESIAGSERSPLSIQNWGVCTQKKNKLFLHVFNWPVDGKLMVGGLHNEIKRAYLLADKSMKLLAVERVNANDLCVQLPATAPDKVNSVVVLETNTPIVSDSTRLLSSNSSNRLLGFDAQMLGVGLSLGDGKTNSYTVKAWVKDDQKLSWDFRLNTPTIFRISLKYIGSANSEGTFKILADQQTITESQIAVQEKEGPITLDLGNVTLAKGTHTIMITPIKITKKDLMKLLEITLTPVVL